ncbi:MAG: trypsin-like peptidase domain-containing protein [Ruminococcus sp.]
MYEREQDRMKHDMTNTTNTSASESKQPEQAAPHAGTSADSSVSNTTGNYNGVTNTGSTTGYDTTGYHAANTNSYGASNVSNTSGYGTGTASGSYGYPKSPVSGGYSSNSATSYTAQPGNMGNAANNKSAQQGYSYVNYYSNPNTPAQVSGSGKPPKKKGHFWMKAVAFVAAMAVVSAGSIGIFNAVQNSKKLVPADSSSTSSEVAEDTKEEQQADSNQNSTVGLSDSTAQSWIELSAGTDAMSIRDIVKKVKPSVVGVQATFQMSNNYNYSYGFGMFGNGGNSSRAVTGVGTGIIMREDGYIVTNAHVIYDSEYGCGEATAVEIRMSDEETTYDAKVVAYDIETDLAVLKVDQTGLVAAEFGDSDSCQVGDTVVAIGNPLGLELQNTVTCGIISALNRKVTINDKTMTLIQTDTAINNGNSGGPLINSSGQVIGINSAKMSSSVSSSGATIEGIGFAIPMTEAREIVDDLINYGYVTGRPQLGISCQDVSEAVSQAYNLPIGAYIISITEGGAADEAGLQVGDIITAINDNTIQTTEELNNYKNECNAGDTVTLTIVRNGQEQKVNVVLKEVTKNQQS